MQVIGVGADGWGGLTAAALDALRNAEVVFGSKRQLDLLPAEVTAERVAWPSPLVPALHELDPGRRTVVLASGDPTFFGIATTIARELPGLALEVIPHPSSVSLACARLGWAQQDADVISLVGRPVSALQPAIQPGRRLLLLASSGAHAGEVAELLRARGYGSTVITALSDLGADDEQRVTATADDWLIHTGPLTVLALECRADPGAPRRARTPGLPDDAYENDGQLTKRHVRALTVATLAPAPGELLWDVGGGAGSIGIEWMRTHPACRAITVERDPDRASRITRNGEALGVPDLEVVVGSAPEALHGLDTPDAIFVGGGLTGPGLLETCWAALEPGGRLVANVTTLESELLVAEARARWGGELVRIQITSASPVGRFTGWRPAMPVTQWSAVKGTT